MTNNRINWPTDHNFQESPELSDMIKLFIEDQLNALQKLDEQRVIWASENLPTDYHVTYHFHDHCHRVADDMERMAEFLALPPPAPANLYWAMLAHDIGKSVLPVDLWDSVEQPEDETKARRREHTTFGVQIVENQIQVNHPFIGLMKDIMLYHHEHMDGSGHFGLTGDQLSLPVRLACIIESFDGYSIPRYHFGDRDTSTPAVLERMRTEKGESWYDMELLEAFAEMKMSAYKGPQMERINDAEIPNTQSHHRPPRYD